MDLSGIGAIFEHSVLAGVTVVLLVVRVREQREHRADMRACHARTDAIQKQRVGEAARYAAKLERIAEEQHRVLGALGTGGEDLR